jgi:hypothetical protein
VPIPSQINQVYTRTVCLSYSFRLLSLNEENGYDLDSVEVGLIPELNLSGVQFVTSLHLCTTLMGQNRPNISVLVRTQKTQLHFDATNF